MKQDAIDNRIYVNGFAFGFDFGLGITSVIFHRLGYFHSQNMVDGNADTKNV